MAKHKKAKSKKKTRSNNFIWTVLAGIIGMTIAGIWIEPILFKPNIKYYIENDTFSTKMSDVKVSRDNGVMVFLCKTKILFENLWFVRGYVDKAEISPVEFAPDTKFEIVNIEKKELSYKKPIDIEFTIRCEVKNVYNVKDQEITRNYVPRHKYNIFFYDNKGNLIKSNSGIKYAFYIGELNELPETSGRFKATPIEK